MRAREKAAISYSSIFGGRKTICVCLLACLLACLLVCLLYDGYALHSLFFGRLQWLLTSFDFNNKGG
jgi:hypothetical protein